MPFVESVIFVQGTPEETYNIAREMERYPEFMENVEEVKVQQREDNITVTSWVTNVDGRVIKWREKDIFDDVNKQITYKQINGDLKKFEGEWTFNEKEQGTEIRLTVDFELGIPMIGGLINPLLTRKTKSNCESMLKAIKSQVENN